MTRSKAKAQGLHELLYQALETELGGAQICQAAPSCATGQGWHDERDPFHRQTLHHQDVPRSAFRSLGLDERTQTAGRRAVMETARSLVDVSEHARQNAAPAVAQRAAAECVVLAETNDHRNRELIGCAADQLSGDAAQVPKEAHDEVEADEDHHLYRTRGRAREMWFRSMGFEAVLPSPEEVRGVASAAGAAKAERAPQDDVRRVPPAA
ncbi:hypothetical protein [Burkholderia plantarii]|uniref:hypothetical protein n=1 Tax=Burkholderia plantarii TaxID=41899 RepID=UPI0018DD82BC|nr:hypothetical protein [Burkholderia plantarii]MBI0325728.1 hypothetical protein [Burkholderia plantarii]